MGGYGAILLAEKYPRLIGAVAAISPAIWTSYARGQVGQRGRVRVGRRLRGTTTRSPTRPPWSEVPVRVASGFGDPFYPGVQALARALPGNPGGAPAEVYFGSGCHTGAFFNAQEPPSLAFLARHLTSAAR